MFTTTTLLLLGLLATAGACKTQVSAPVADAGKAPAAAEPAAPQAADPPALEAEARPAQPVLGPQPELTPQVLVPGEGVLYAILRTTQGNMVARLFEKESPLAVSNFVGLATGQLHYRDPRTGEVGTGAYYDGTLFHRVIPRFMIQGGDPTGTGRGNPGYQFKNERSGLKFDKGGYLAMANSGPDTNGSQFFVTEVATPHLDGGFSIFGRLVRGQEVVAEIARVRTAPGNRPLEPVVLEKVEIVRSKEPPKP